MLRTSPGLFWLGVALSCALGVSSLSAQAATPQTGNPPTPAAVSPGSAPTVGPNHPAAPETAAPAAAPSPAPSPARGANTAPVPAANPAKPQTDNAASSNAPPGQNNALPQTKIFDAPDAPRADLGTDPYLSVPPLPKNKVTMIGGVVRKIDQIRNRIEFEPFGSGKKMNLFFDERSHIFRNGVQTTQLAIHEGDRIYVDTQLVKQRVFARNVRVNTTAGAAQASGQIIDADTKLGVLTLRDTLSAQPVAFRIDPSTKIQRRDGAPPQLTPGSLVAVSFTPDTARRGFAQQVTIIAAPGDVFTFTGPITFLDVRGTMALANDSDKKTYDLQFDPAQVQDGNSLQVGTEVVVKARFDGTGYTAQSLERVKRNP